jgi:glycosyltransferase 2 family protein
LASKVKALLKTFLKFAVSGAALYIVFRNIDPEQTKNVLLGVQPGWLALAALLFILSKVVSSVRLNLYFNNAGLSLTQGYNLRLYWVGMFYNLFLPGGIGGDGYKVYLLNKRYETGIRPLIAATLLDRVSGLCALLFLAGVGYLFLDRSLFPGWIVWVNLVGLAVLFPAFYGVVRRFFVAFLPSFFPTLTYGFAVQLLQVFSAWFILMSLGVNELVLEYQVLFLVSSVVAVFPFTIGGVGARELTFILGYQFLGIDQNVAVAFSLLFFLITAVVSMVGGFLKTSE